MNEKTVPHARFKYYYPNIYFNNIFLHGFKMHAIIVGCSFPEIFVFFFSVV